MLAILSGQNINLDLFYDKNMLTKNEWCKYVVINPKFQAIFVHTIINVIFKYMLQEKNTKELFNNNFGVIGHIKAHYGCYETTKMVAYISTHYYGLMVFQIPTHLYKHYLMMRFFNKIWLIIWMR